MTGKALFITAGIVFLAVPSLAGELQEKNKAVARIVFEEVLGRGRIEENEAIYSPDYVSHGADGDMGREEDRKTNRGWRQAFPDLRITVDKMVAEGDLVAIYFQAEGTNTGAANGFPATGKAFKLNAMSLLRIAGGKVVEEWTSFDRLTLLQQLGLLPSRAK